MRDDTNERDALLNHAHPHEPPDLPAELLPTHEALTQLAEVWSATIPAAERLATFTRQLPAQAPRTEKRPATSLRDRARREAHDTRPAPGRGRLLAGLAAAVVIVGLLSATLLRLSTGRPGHRPHPTPTPTPSLTARAAEEPSQQPPSASWTLIAREHLLPAPSDGNIVYRVSGNAASVSTDSGATWRALALPTLSQTRVNSEDVTLVVSAVDPHVILFFGQVNLASTNPADCPAGSSPIQPTALHGGILASGFISCTADFISRTGGDPWIATHGLSGSFTSPVMWQSGDTLYGLVDDMEPRSAPTFPLVGYHLMVSHDLGVQWSEQDSMLTPSARFLCSFMQSKGDSALYAVTAAAPCFSGTEGAQNVMRSVDGGATWRQASTINGFSATLLAATPAVNGHGAWLYLLREHKGSSPVTPTLTHLVSADGGATWQAIPQPPQPGVPARLRQTAGVLADGSLVLAVVVQGSDPTQVPEQATFYAWRPGDRAWRPLTTSLTAYYSSYFLDPASILITHGGQRAEDTLWVVEALRPTGPTNFMTQAYPIR